MSDLVPYHTYSKLSAIVDMACIEVEVSVNHYFKKFLAHACWGLSELKLDQANDVCTELLPISDVNTVTLPSNAIDWVKIGIPWGQYVKPLSINGDLSKIDRTIGNPQFTYSVSPGWLPSGTNISPTGGGFEFCNFNGSSLYAIGGGIPNEGHFTMVKRSDGVKEILLDGPMTGIPNLYVEYIGLGLNPCGETIVDPYLKDYVLKYILLKYEENSNPRRTEASIARRQRDLAYADTLVRGRTNSLDVETLLTITRRHYSLLPKV